jgi:hypothetical protein
MQKTRISIVLICSLLASCATYVTPAPNLVSAPIEIAGIRLVNDTPQAEPRNYFSDGITTYKTDYRGWTQVVINSYGVALSKVNRPSTTARSISFSIQGINCSGHYVADCSLSLLVTRSDGEKKIFSTDTYNSYPIESALRRALDAAANLAFTDVSLNQFVNQ